MADARPPEKRFGARRAAVSAAGDPGSVYRALLLRVEQVDRFYAWLIAIVSLAARINSESHDLLVLIRRFDERGRVDAYLASRGLKWIQHFDRPGLPCGRCRGSRSSGGRRFAVPSARR